MMRALGSGSLLTLLGAVASLLAGCAVYQWGETDSTHPRSIYIAPVENRTEIPQIRALLTEQLRQTLIHHPGWRLAREREAEAILEVTVDSVESRTAATREDDTGRGASFSVTLQATSHLRMAGPARPNRTTEVDGLLFDAPGQPTVAYQALPALTQKLAEQIIDQVALEMP